MTPPVAGGVSRKVADDVDLANESTLALECSTGRVMVWDYPWNSATTISLGGS